MAFSTRHIGAGRDDRQISAAASMAFELPMDRHADVSRMILSTRGICMTLP